LSPTELNKINKKPSFASKSGTVVIFDQNEKNPNPKDDILA
jgi:hypothetical protein